MHRRQFVLEALAMLVPAACAWAEAQAHHRIGTVATRYRARTRRTPPARVDPFGWLSHPQPRERHGLSAVPLQQQVQWHPRDLLRGLRGLRHPLDGAETGTL